MKRIRKGDEVVVISGRDRGKRGTVLRRTDDEHVIVEGINRVKKHQRPNPMQGQTGGIVDKDMPIHVSNLALFNPATQKGDRVSFKSTSTATGENAKIPQQDGTTVDVRDVGGGGSTTATYDLARVVMSGDTTAEFHAVLDGKELKMSSSQKLTIK